VRRYEFGRMVVMIYLKFYSGICLERLGVAKRIILKWEKKYCEPD
jgi:hypothetical protein